MLKSVWIGIFCDAAFGKFFGVANGNNAVGRAPLAVMQAAAGGIARLICPFDSAAARAWIVLRGDRFLACRLT